MDKSIFENKEKFNLFFPNALVNLICDNCEEQFQLQRSKYRAKLLDGSTKFFCCRQCYLNNHSNSPREYICQYCKQSFISRHHENANLFCSRKCYDDSQYHSKTISGENHWRYDPNSPSRGERNSPEYSAFRMGILKRDNFTCSCCKKRGGKLVVHHILSWTYYPDLRFDSSNVCTLCLECHKQLHLYYGYTTNKPMTIKEFLEQCRNTKK